MIKVTRFNGKPLFINAELIQFVEGTPDTVITLVNDTRMIIAESPEEVVDLILAYRQKLFSGIIDSKSGD